MKASEIIFMLFRPSTMWKCGREKLFEHFRTLFITFVIRIICAMETKRFVDVAAVVDRIVERKKTSTVNRKTRPCSWGWKSMRNVTKVAAQHPNCRKFKFYLLSCLFYAAFQTWMWASRVVVSHSFADSNMKFVSTIWWQWSEFHDNIYFIYLMCKHFMIHAT